MILENENLDGRPDVSPSMILQQSAAFCNLDLRMDTASLSTSGVKGVASLILCKVLFNASILRVNELKMAGILIPISFVIWSDSP